MARSLLCSTELRGVRLIVPKRRGPSAPSEAAYDRRDAISVLHDWTSASKNGGSQLIEQLRILIARRQRSATPRKCQTRSVEATLEGHPDRTRSDRAEPQRRPHSSFLRP